MKAYITYLSSDDYYIGVLTLFQSWKENRSKTPFYCAANNNVSNAIKLKLKQRGVNIINVPELIIPKNIIGYNQKYCKADYETLKNYFNKLIIFALDMFDKIIYMDADMIMLENIDNLFNEPNMSAVLDHTENDRHLFNSAIMVIKPDKDLFKDLYNKLGELQEQEIYDNSNKHHHCFWDQDYLNLYFNKWSIEYGNILHVGYNSFVDAFNFYGIEKSEVKVAHLVTKKPWKMTIMELYDKIEENKYNSNFMYIKFLDLLNKVL